ncbi:MAG: hypothetical protein ACK4R6_14555 [Spirosomataceae bacterium]
MTKGVFKNLIVFAVLFFCKNSIVAQPTFYYSNLNTQLGVQIEPSKSVYSVYPENYVFSKEYGSIEDSERKTPEETLISAFSSLDYDWEQSCYAYELKKNNSKYELKRQSSKQKNNFKLIRKLEFSFGEESYAIVKYRVLENGKLLPMANVLKKIDNDWKIIMPENSLSKIFVMFNYLSEFALDGIFLQKPTNVSYFDNFVKKSWLNNTLDLVRCMNYTPQNKMTKAEELIIMDIAFSEPENPIQSYPEINFLLEEVKNQKLNLIYILEFPSQKLYYYVDENEVNPKIDNELKNFERIDFQRIKPLVKFTFIYLENTYAVLKYNNVETSESFTSIFALKTNKWQSVKETPFFTPVIRFFNTISIDQLKLVSSVGTLEELETQQLRERIKDANNIINVLNI